MRRDLDLKLLRTFLTIGDCGGFTRAAERLHLTQSAVSNQLKRLEEHVGATLIARGGKVEALTEEGRVLQAYARRIIKINDEALAQLLPMSVSGLVRIGVVEEFATPRFAAVLNAFNARHSAVKIELTVGLTRHLRIALERDELDLVVGKRPIGADGKGLPLYREKLVWVAHRDFRLASDEAVPLILSPAPCFHRAAVLDALEKAHHPWRIVCHAPTLTSVRTAVTACLGVSALDESAVTSQMRALGPKDGLPALPDNEVALYSASKPSTASALICELIRNRIVSTDAGGRDVARAPTGSRAPERSALGVEEMT